VKAFQGDLVPPSSGCSRVMPARTLSFPFHAMSVSDCHRTTALLSPVTAGFGFKSIRRKKKGAWWRAQPLYSGLIAVRDGRPTFDGCTGRSACCSQQMAAACRLQYAAKRCVSHTNTVRKELT
jgi:hypothetical protein